MSDSLPPRFAHLRLRDLMLIELIAESGSLTDAAARLKAAQTAYQAELAKSNKGGSK